MATRAKAEGPKAPASPLAPAVSRAIQMLNVVAETGRPMSLSELAARLGIVKSSAFAICTTLAAGGLLHRSADGYQLGAHVMAFANAYLKQTSLPQLFLSLIASRQSLLPHTVNLSVLDGLDVVYMISRPGAHQLGIEIRMGTRLPAFQAATGRAILSTLSAEHLEEKLAQFAPVKLTAKTDTRLPKIRKLLAQAALDGHSVDDEGVRDGMLAFGAPVFGPNSGEAVAGVAVALHKAGATTRVRKEAVAELRFLARTLSTQLGAAL